MAYFDEALSLDVVPPSLALDVLVITLARARDAPWQLGLDVAETATAISKQFTPGAFASKALFERLSAANEGAAAEGALKLVPVEERSDDAELYRRGGGSIYGPQISCCCVNMGALIHMFPPL